MKKIGVKWREFLGPITRKDGDPQEQSRRFWTTEPKKGGPTEESSKMCRRRSRNDGSEVGDGTPEESGIRPPKLV